MNQFEFEEELEDDEDVDDEEDDDVEDDDDDDEEDELGRFFTSLGTFLTFDLGDRERLFLITFEITDFVPFLFGLLLRLSSLKVCLLVRLRLLDTFLE